MPLAIRRCATIRFLEPDRGISDTNDPMVLLLREEIGECYEALARSAASAVGAERCHLALYDDRSEELISRRPRYEAASRALPQFRFPLASAPASARAVQTGEPYISNDPANDPLYDSSVRERDVRSVLTVPVRRDGRCVGLLYALNKPGGFTSDDARKLIAMAPFVAVALENIRRYSEERDRRILGESLRDLTRTLVGTLAEDVALGTVLDQMWRVVGYQAAAAVVKDGEVLRVAACRGGEPGAEVPLATAGDLRAIVEGRFLGILTDSATVLPQLGISGAGGKALAAPLAVRGEVLGALVVCLEPELIPGLRDGQLVGAFADHGALFLEAAAVLRRERQVRARAAGVARITRLAASRKDSESLLPAVAPELLALSGADRVALYLTHALNPVLIPIACAGGSPGEEEHARDLRLDMAVGPLVPLLEERTPVTFYDPKDLSPGNLTAFTGVQALLLLPLTSRGETLGAIALASVRPRRFEPALIEFLSDVAQQVALGVENARLFATLARMAATDELTQLANRRRFTEALKLELARARRNQTPVSLVMADLDFLKRINDTHGHHAGDAAIRHVAEAFKRERRATDLAARLGGEEFALLLPGTDLLGAVTAAEKIRSDVASTPIPNVGGVTVSVGVATFPEDGSEEQQLMRAADSRLYLAKTSGRNQVRYLTAVEEALTRPLKPMSQQ
jgi:diguanylate cyclase (GGDEF)-like protein